MLVRHNLHFKPPQILNRLSADSLFRTLYLSVKMPLGRVALDNVTLASVPEPSTIIMLLGFVAAGMFSLRRVLAVHNVTLVKKGIG